MRTDAIPARTLSSSQIAAVVFPKSVVVRARAAGPMTVELTVRAVIKSVIYAPSSPCNLPRGVVERMTARTSVTSRVTKNRNLLFSRRDHPPRGAYLGFGRALLFLPDDARARRLWVDDLKEVSEWYVQLRKITLRRPDRTVSLHH
jgi:hypothetical protein